MSNEHKFVFTLSNGQMIETEIGYEFLYHLSKTSSRSEFDRYVKIVDDNDQTKLSKNTKEIFFDGSRPLICTKNSVMKLKDFLNKEL